MTLQAQLRRLIPRQKVCPRLFASKPREGAWQLLPAGERAAWQALGWREESWAGGQAPLSSLQSFEELRPGEKAAVLHGLKLSKEDWDEILHSDHALVVEPSSSTAPAAASSRGSGGGLMSSIAKAAWGAAPIVGAALAKSRHPAAIVAGHMLQQAGQIVESVSDTVTVNGLETTLYLDDSGSMSWTNRASTTPLIEGHKVLSALSPLLRGSTRIVKFGSVPTVLAPREESHNISQSLMQLNWDASSGGTYMWHMIQEDVLARYRPGTGTLRLVVVTDGQDTQSPAAYNGIGGMNPMQRTLLRAGFDIEWHIVVLGKDVGGQREYESLAGATGGSFLSIDTFREESPDVKGFLNAIHASSQGDQEARRRRQHGYELEASKGTAQRFEWYKALPPPGKSK